MKQLLVATDLSERSDRAIDRAVRLANRSDAQLTVLHVIDDDLPAGIADRQKRAAGEALRDHISSIPDAAKLNPKLAVDFGKDWTEILRIADAERSDLIILGMHRERAFEGFFRGTTVERVVRGGNAPVLVVKNRAHRDYRTIIVGVDFSVYSRRAVEFAVEFAGRARVCLVHAYDIPFRSYLTGADSQSGLRKRDEEQLARMIDEEMAGFLSGLEAKGVRIERVMAEGEPQEVIPDQVAKLDADLLVLGTHGRTGVAHALLGSVTEGFLTDPPCDVLAVKAW